VLNQINISYNILQYTELQGRNFGLF